MARLARFVDGLVPARLADDRLEWRRHRAFIVANLFAGLAALGLVPLWLAFAGPTGVVETVALLGLVAPAPVALWVSHGGSLRDGQLLASALAAFALAWIAFFTGGVASPALIALGVVPMEAALSGRRDVTRVAFGFALVAFVAIAGLDLAGRLPSPIVGGVAARLAAPALAMLYAGALALRMELLARTGDEIARRRGDHFRLVAENISDIVTGHAADGSIVFVTPAAERVLGVQSDAIRGDGLFRMVHVGDRPAYLTALSDAASRGRSATVEFRVRVDDATGRHRWLWLELSCRPLDDRDPLVGAAQVVAVTRDVTERKAQEAELLAAREAAEEASFAKTRFLANVSHELRTPLNAIIGFSEMLSAEIFGPLGDPRQREYVELIHESGRHLLQVVNDILDMSKIESGTFDVVPEPFDLLPLLDSVRQMMSLQAGERGLRIEVETADRLPEIVADRRACKQILINLMSNAVKFTDRNGVVTLGARREGDHVAVFVRDTGIGIAEKDIARLGTPFVQADSGYDRRHEGTGLGLSVVKGLTRLHGGAMSIESRLGEGTCVTVRLPLVPDQGHARVEPRVVGLPAPSAPRPLEQKRA
ncbi:MAG: PAS domain-containing sensor histidine kinase [Hyphomicrobiales bacterium]|nr:PAS domain-containing sensor histidine kinase [Hyphomicrobiales bacterium]